MPYRRTFIVVEWYINFLFIQGATRVYNKRGVRLGKFSSALPGGTYQDYKSNCTILDCIWEKDTKTYFTLDVLAWSNQPLLNCDVNLIAIRNQIEIRLNPLT